MNNTYIDFGKEVNDNGPKFKVGDHVRISKYKNIFAESYTPNWSEEAFLIKKIKNTVPWINTFTLAMVLDLTVRVNLLTLRVEWLEI